MLRKHIPQMVAKTVTFSIGPIPNGAKVLEGHRILVGSSKAKNEGAEEWKRYYKKESIR